MFICLTDHHALGIVNRKIRGYVVQYNNSPASITIFIFSEGAECNTTHRDWPASVRTFNWISQKQAPLRDTAPEILWLAFAGRISGRTIHLQLGAGQTRSETSHQMPIEPFVGVAGFTVLCLAPPSELPRTIIVPVLRAAHIRVFNHKALFLGGHWRRHSLPRFCPHRLSIPPCVTHG